MMNWKMSEALSIQLIRYLFSTRNRYRILQRRGPVVFLHNNDRPFVSV